LTIFLKLGGSLITDKNRVETAREEVLQRISAEVASAQRESQHLSLLLGHGSGSYGHQAAARFGTHGGAKTMEEWRGFASVWSAASRLTRLVIDSLVAAGLPAVAFPPSASAVCQDGELIALASEPVERALAADLLPVVRGDVAFDRKRGSSIVSTEKVMTFLAPILRPSLVLLAGVEPGVFADFPQNQQLLPEITPEMLANVRLGGARSTDVTGGMADKVNQAFVLAKSVPGVQVRIFSGMESGAVRQALAGAPVGTLIRLD
jgi:isopentenyl phosphate kinase